MRSDQNHYSTSSNPVGAGMRQANLLRGFARVIVFRAPELDGRRRLPRRRDATDFVAGGRPSWFVSTNGPDFVLGAESFDSKPLTPAAAEALREILESPARRLLV